MDSGLLSGTGPKNITKESPSLLKFQQELQLLNSKQIKICRCATKEVVPKTNENHLSIRNKELNMIIGCKILTSNMEIYHKETRKSKK